MRIRKYLSSDLAGIARLFYDTVHTINARDYSPEQLDAWATGHIDAAEWDSCFLSHTTFVATEQGNIVGFGNVDANGHLDKLYVHKDFQGRGIATALCERLEKATEAKIITVHASITAKPFFEQRGYKVKGRQQVKRQNVLLANYVMELHKPSPALLP